MPVVVPVRMLVLQRIVPVLVAMRFGQMQHDAGQHQNAAGGHRPRGRTVAQCQRQRSTDEGCEGKDRAGARGAEGTLREQIKAQAQPVADRADREQREHRCGRRQGNAERECEQRAGRRAQCRLGHDDLPRIALGQCARQGVVDAPGQRGEQHREQSVQMRSAADLPAVEHQHERAGEQQRHRARDPRIDGFAVHPPGEQGREERLQREHQRRAGAARALQSPRERDRPEHRAEPGHREQPRCIFAPQARLAFDRPARQRAHQRRSRIQQRGRAEGADARAVSLHERRADAEQQRGQQREQRATQGGEAGAQGHAPILPRLVATQPREPRPTHIRDRARPTRMCRLPLAPHFTSTRT